LAGTNALAYYEKSQLTAVKRFYKICHRSEMEIWRDCFLPKELSPEGILVPSRDKFDQTFCTLLGELAR